MSFESKYLKYKEKYLSLKNMTGGMDLEAHGIDPNWRNQPHPADFVYVPRNFNLNNIPSGRDAGGGGAGAGAGAGPGPGAGAGPGPGPGPGPGAGAGPGAGGGGGGAGAGGGGGGAGGGGGGAGGGGGGAGAGGGGGGAGGGGAGGGGGGGGEYHYVETEEDRAIHRCTECRREFMGASGWGNQCGRGCASLFRDRQEREWNRNHPAEAARNRADQQAAELRSIIAMYPPPVAGRDFTVTLSIEAGRNSIKISGFRRRILRGASYEIPITLEEVLQWLNTKGIVGFSNSGFSINKLDGTMLINFSSNETATAALERVRNELSALKIQLDTGTRGKAAADMAAYRASGNCRCGDCRRKVGL